MTDRVHTLTVILEKEMRDDDASEVAKVIAGIRFVKKVELGPVMQPNDYAVRHTYIEALGRLREAAGEALGIKRDRDT